jgi:hypothetical protein
MNLNDILTELSKPVWWFSVVVAGIAINLLSSYLKSRLDKTVASTSSWWRRRSADRQRSWEARVEQISSSEEVRNAEVLSELRQRLQSIHMLLLAIFLLLLPLFTLNSLSPPPQLITTIILGLSAFLFFASFLAFLGSATTASALRSARRRPNNSLKRAPEEAA